MAEAFIIIQQSQGCIWVLTEKKKQTKKWKKKRWCGVMISAKKRISISFEIATMECTHPLIRFEVTRRNSQENSHKQTSFLFNLTKGPYKVEEGSLYTRGFLVLETKRLVVQVRKTCNTSYKLFRVC